MWRHLATQLSALRQWRGGFLRVHRFPSLVMVVLSEPVYLGSNRVNIPNSYGPKKEVVHPRLSVWNNFQSELAGAT